MTDGVRVRAALIQRILAGDGSAPQSIRQEAFNNEGLPGPIQFLVNKVARSANEVTDEDFARARSSRLSEDQIFEIVICAAIGQASRQLDAAHAAVDAFAGRK